MKRILFLIFLVKILIINAANVSHTVSNPIMGFSNSLDVVLDASIIEANNGDDVTIYLDSPFGLIHLQFLYELTSNGMQNILEIPIINNTNTSGSITILPGTNHPNVPQGIRYDEPTLIEAAIATQSGAGIRKSAFIVNGNAVNITFKDLVFESFNAVGVTVPIISINNSSSIIVDNCHFNGGANYGVSMVNSGTIKIKDCLFENFNEVCVKADDSEQVTVEGSGFFNSSVGIGANLTTDITVENNNFYGNETSISCNYEPTNPVSLLPLSRKISVLNNTITVPSTSQFFNLSDGITIGFNDRCQEIIIEGNSLQNIRKSINVFNNSSDNSCLVKINDNLIFNDNNGLLGINLGSPRITWEIDDNDIFHIDIGIKVTSTLDDNNNLIDARVNFINSNSFGEPLFNSNNKVENGNTSFYFDTKPENNSKVIGYKVDGKIVVDGSWPVDIRENLINIDGPDTEPIVLTGYGNKEIAGLVIEQVQYNGFDIIIDFKIDEMIFGGGNYGPYEVEFFISGADNDLLEYLGKSSNVIGNGQTVSVSLTSANLSLIGKVGGTITSYSQSSGYNVGTSEVVYENYSIDQAPTCDACGSFKVDPTVDYWMSAWVKVDNPDQVITYKDATGPEVNIFGVETGAINQTINLTPEGEIIDGWQRIVGKLEIPDGTENIYLSLKSDETFDTYFDDIRMHPFNASMKSYVYDGETFWLTSELDNNNYATFYEYDNEGGLVRIKKETSRGIVTIQETRSHTSTEN